MQEQAEEEERLKRQDAIDGKYFVIFSIFAAVNERFKRRIALRHFFF